jgi:hypothetical protein
MMDDDLHRRLKERLAAPRAPALERVRSFLLYHVHDSDPELLDRDLRGLMKVNASPIIDAVQAIEELIAQPQLPGAILRAVSHEGNQMLDEETDEAATKWLRELALQLRQILGEYAPPRAGGDDAS